MQNSIKFFLILVFLSAALPARADIYTHSLGDAGYMLREAVQAHAPILAKDLFLQALKKQREAKNALQKHQKDKSLSLAQEAFNLAKQARDQALAQPQPDLMKERSCPTRVKGVRTSC